MKDRYAVLKKKSNEELIELFKDIVKSEDDNGTGSARLNVVTNIILERMSK